MKPKTLALVVAGLLVAGGGAFALTRFMAPAEDEAIAFAPEDSFLYVNLFIRPSNGQKMALDDLLKKFPGLESTDDVVERLTETFDEELSKEGLSFEEDIEPWLGDQLAAFAIPGGTAEQPDGALLVESEDDEAFRDFFDRVTEEEDVQLREREYEGVTYEVEEGSDDPAAIAFLEGFAAIGTEDGIKAAIDASGGASLQDTEKFENATSPLHDDWIGQFYIDAGGIFDAFQGEIGTPEDQALFDAFALEDQPPGAAVLYVSSDSIAFESAGAVPREGPLAAFGQSFTGSGLLPDLPPESWIAFGIPELGNLFSGYLDLFASLPGFEGGAVESQLEAQTGLNLEEDLLSWMGDAGFFLQGANVQEIGGGLIVESSDPAKTRSALESLRGLLTAQGVPARPVSRGGLEGFSIQIPGSPAPVYVLSGNRLVITYGEAATNDAVSGGESLEGSEAFDESMDDLGGDFEPSFFIDVDAAQAFAESIMAFSGGMDARYEDEIKPYVDPFSHLIGGTRRDGETVVQKFVVGVR